MDVDDSAPAVFKVVSNIMKPDSSFQLLNLDQAKSIQTFFQGVKISHNDTMSVSEYADLFDSTEIRRMRRVMQSIFQGQPETELRDTVRQMVSYYNREISQFAKKDRYKFGEIIVDIFGRTEREPSPQGGFWFTVLKAAANVAHSNVTSIVEDLDNTRVGDVVDLLRGTLNFTSPTAIRLHYLRRKLAGS